MINEAVNQYFILNGKEFKVEEAKDVAIKEPLIYEVNRVMDGVVLFEESHIERLSESIKLLGYSMDYSFSEISEMMKSLIKLNDVKNQNIKVVYGDLSGKQQILLYFVKSTYPEKEVYSKGIQTILYESERENPNAKVVNSSLRERIDDALKEKGAFEALLVDENGNITEGSRSNFFYIREGKLYTPPAEKVLLGITRKEVIRAAKASGIELLEKNLNANDINEIEGAFLTGTSIDALPISQISDIDLNTAENSIMKTIIEKYNDTVKEYIKEKKA